MHSDAIQFERSNQIRSDPIRSDQTRYDATVSVGSQVNKARGGQRIATVLIYLAEPEEGGETIFPYVGSEQCRCGSEMQRGICIKPRKGNAVVFWTMRPDGRAPLPPLCARSVRILCLLCVRMLCIHFVSAQRPLLRSAPCLPPQRRLSSPAAMSSSLLFWRAVTVTFFLHR